MENVFSYGKVDVRHECVISQNFFIGCCLTLHTRANLILTIGTITMKMAPSLVRLCENILEPKYVNLMGACSITRCMFSTKSYNTICGVDKLIHIHIYLSSCPPRPKAIIDVVTKLHKKVAQANNYRNKDRASSSTKKRYFGI